MIRVILRLFTPRRRRWRELFSLAIDDRLSEAEAAELERILDRWPEARNELDAMREAVTALRAAPQVEPRRSFRLTPDMVEAETPAPAGRLPAFVPVAAGAAALLVFAIIGGTLGLFDGGPAADESPQIAVAPSGPAGPAGPAGPERTPIPAPAATSTPVPPPTSAPAATPTSAPAAMESDAAAMRESTPAPAFEATAMPAPTAMAEPTATPEAMMVAVTATPAPAATSTAQAEPTATPAPMLIVSEPTATPMVAMSAGDTPTSEALATSADGRAVSSEPTEAVIVVAVTPTTAPPATATPQPPATVAPTSTPAPTPTPAPTAPAVVVVITATPTAPDIEADTGTLDPSGAEGNVAELEAVLREYVDDQRAELRGPQGPPGRAGTEGADDGDGVAEPAGPRGATGGLGPQGPTATDSVAEPRGQMGEQGPKGAQHPPPSPEPDGGFPWLPLQIAAAVLLAAILAFGAWSYLQR